MSCLGKECCCNCKNQIELFKHPYNTLYKGSILDSADLYACIVPFDMDNNKQEGFIFEDKHGECELYVRRK